MRQIAFRITRHMLLWTLLMLALGLTGMRVALWGIHQYQANLAGQLSALLGAPVQIARLQARMHRFSPQLVLLGVNVLAPGTAQPAVTLQELRLSLDMPDGLANGHWLAAIKATLVGLKCTAYRKPDGGLGILGLPAQRGDTAWLWQGKQWAMVQGDITWLRPNQSPLRLPDTHLAITNQGDQHQIKALVKWPNSHNQTLMTVLAFSGNPETPQTLAGRAYLAVKQLPLTTLAWPLDGFTWRNGTLDAEFWGQLDHAALTRLQGQLSLSNVQIAQAQRGQWQMAKLKARVTAQAPKDSPAWQLTASNLVAELNGQPAMTGALGLSGQRVDPPQLQNLALALDRLDVGQILQTVKFFAPKTVSEPTSLPQSASGTLENLQLFADLTQHNAALAADFKQLGMAATPHSPAFSGLSGHLHGSDQRGQLVLHSNAVQLDMPSLFRQPLTLQRLQGALAWRQQNGEWALTTPKLQVDLLGLKTTTRLALSGDPQHPALLLDLQTWLASDDASQLRHYLPVGIMRQDDITWLDNALVRGRIENGKLLYLGRLGEPLAKLRENEDMKPAPSGTATVTTPPYPASRTEPLGGGLFRANFHIADLSLHYAPGWPNINAVYGDLEFSQKYMKAIASQGTSHHLTASQVVAINPEVGQGKILHLTGHFSGKIADALAFLTETPLHDRIAPIAQAIRTQGNTQAFLDLRLPMNAWQPTTFTGHATLDKASLTISALNLPVSDITGILKYDQNGIFSDTIHASAFQEPLQIRLSNTTSDTWVNAQGHAGITELTRQFSFIPPHCAEGALAYQMSLRLPLADNAAEVTVESDLHGTKLNLPLTLGKTETEHRPLKLLFSLNGSGIVPITVQYGGQLQAALDYAPDVQQLVGGHLVLGGTAKPARQPGLQLEITQPQLDLKTLADFAPIGSATPGILPLREIYLHTPSAHWGTAELGALDLKLLRDGNRWQGHIYNRFAMGKIDAFLDSNADRHVNINLSSLDLALTKHLRGNNDQKPLKPPRAEPANALQPQNLPSLNLHSDKTFWQGTELGVLNLATTHQANGLALTDLQILGAEQSLQLSGNWQGRGNGRTETQLKGRLQLADTGQLLRRLAINRDFAETQASVDFSGHWPDAPYRFDLASLKGEVGMTLTEGRILSIEPGFGRLLGMLAMAQWLKRLQLDFRDIFADGLTFNSIRGHFQLAEGKAQIRDLLIDAVPARITVNGSTDFVHRTLSQQASVLPKGADALPIAGTIVDRVATVLAKILTGNEQEGLLLGSQYRLEGSWDNITVTPLRGREGLLPKIWNSLTDFSWTSPAVSATPHNDPTIAQHKEPQ